MDDCQFCTGLGNHLKIDLPEDYIDLIKKLIEYEDNGTLSSILGATATYNIGKPTLREILGNWERRSAFAEDALCHRFECQGCGTHYQLFVDTYHGWGTWGRLGGINHPTPSS